MTADDVLDPGRVIPVPRLDVRVRNRDGTLLVAWAEAVFELEDVSADIWRTLDGRRTLLDVAKVVAATYDVSVDEAAQDAFALLAQLHAARIVEFHDVGPRDEPAS